MIQGTASDVGKSLLVAALCRLCRRRGLSVAPFKSQNMALNASVTRDGHEIGRAQAVQAAAADTAPHVDMNPILLKPEGETGCQVVVEGRVWGRMAAGEYYRRKPELGAVVADSLRRLRAAHDIVIIEGAGSPAEINLRESDIVNMFVAELADAPVWLVGDIDRGGVFASMLGTLMLLEPRERARVEGLVINKFRGDLSLLQPGLRMLEARAEVPVVGVLPHLPELRIADEDSVALDRRATRVPQPGKLDICVVWLPRISNYDDVLALEHEPSAVVRFVREPADLVAADLVILPGSKATRSDLAWLRQRGLDRALSARAGQGRPTLGFCGGYQMLGERIADPQGVEGPAGEVAGLGLLPCETHFAGVKTTRTVTARLRPEAAPLFGSSGAAGPLSGYEIHMGQVQLAPGAAPLLSLSADAVDGCLDAGRGVAGTLVHGLLDDDGLRGGLLTSLWARRGHGGPIPRYRHRPSEQYDRLADWVEAHLDRGTLDRLTGPL